MPGPGKWSAADIDGDHRGKNDARIKIFPDGDGGIVYNWKSDEQQVFFANGNDQLTPEQRHCRQQALAESKAKAEAELQVERDLAAEVAQRLMDSATANVIEHPYAQQKRVNLGPLVKRGEWPQHGWKDALLVPIYAKNKKLRTVEAINTDGAKDFLKGGEKKGCFYPFGKLAGISTVLIGEGLATVAAAADATGLPAVAAMDSGNLEPVARNIRELAPDAEIILLADNDMKADGNNPGVKAAINAANTIGGKVAIPELGGKSCDFWDVWSDSGVSAVKQAITTARDTLPTPEQLPSLPSVISFDYAYLPDGLRGYVMDISERMQCPPDFAAVTVFVMMSSIIGRKVGIRPMRHNDWTVVCNLWGAVVGNSGVMKSPTMNATMAPIKKLQALAFEEYNTRLADYAAQAEIAKLQNSVNKSEVKKRLVKDRTADVSALLKAGGAEEEPIMRRYLTNNASYEALGELLMENPNGLLVESDEIIGLLKQLDVSGQETARSFYLTAADGDKPYTFDRIMRGKGLHIPALCLSIIGGIQPGVLAEYVRQATGGGAGADGLLQRFSLMVYPDISPDWREVDRYPDSDK
jgi:putative DNA primase/helicase